ncbi:MAG: ABC transporter ATP-binding protein [Deltaproteobacteria bacterium]|nr:MAG: ABC transporter ATP-binding protein [Deltaproteobacteria bacterium]
MSVLRLENVTKSFGGLMAVSGLDFAVSKGEIVGLIGPNGAGKTTVFNLISAFLKPDSGAIFFGDHDITHLKPHQICKKGLCRTFQIVKPFLTFSVKKNVRIGSYNRLTEKQEIEAQTMEILDLIGLADQKDVTAKNLSIGDRKKLELAKALATKPSLLLLDEVMAGLNPKEQNDMIHIILELKNRGTTILLIEHTMKVIMSLSERIIVLNYGKKIAEGPPSDIGSNEEVIEAYLGERYFV